MNWLVPSISQILHSTSLIFSKRLMLTYQECSAYRSPKRGTWLTFSWDGGMAAKSKCNKFTHGKKRHCSVYDKLCSAEEAGKCHKISSCPPLPLSTSPSSLHFLLRKAAVASKKYFTTHSKCCSCITKHLGTPSLPWDLTQSSKLLQLQGINSAGGNYPSFLIR